MKIETQELFVGPANFKQLLINVLTLKVKVNIKLIESFRLKFLVLPNISSFSDESLKLKAVFLPKARLTNSLHTNSKFKRVSSFAAF